jgi:hypothetical protein
LTEIDEFNSALVRAHGKEIRWDMDPKVRRWLIAPAIGIALFVLGMASHLMQL